MLIRSFLIMGVRHATIDNNNYSFTMNMAAKMSEYNHEIYSTDYELKKHIIKLHFYFLIRK